MPIREILVFVLIVSCALFDLRARRIPNRLTLPMIVLGLLLSAGSGTALWSSFLSVFSVLFLGFFASRAGLLGGGDVKMLAAVGALLGHELLLESLLWTALIGGLISVVLLAHRRALVPFLRRVSTAVYAWARWGTSEPVVEGKGHQVPLGVIIAAGTTAALISERLAFEWIV